MMSILPLIDETQQEAQREDEARKGIPMRDLASRRHLSLIQFVPAEMPAGIDVLQAMAGAEVQLELCLFIGHHVPALPVECAAFD